jgi:hypothetical protein
VLTPDPQLAVDYGLFSVSQALAAGISRREIDRGVRRGRWDRPERGMLRAACREARPGDDLLMAVLRAGPNAVAAFESAAEVHGWDLLKPPTKPQLIVPLGSRSHPGAYRAALSAADVMICGVLPLTTPVQTALDIGAMASLDHSVVAIDSALRSRSVTLVQLHERFSDSARRGVRAARQALALADPLSGSVPETQVRLIFWHAQLPAPVTQYPVYVDGVLIARTDFAWPWAMLLVEIDGFLYHSASGDFQRDRDRQNALVRSGWRVLRFTVADLRNRPAYVIAEVRAALGLA